jgi:hypothetical protein
MNKTILIAFALTVKLSTSIASAQGTLYASNLGQTSLGSLSVGSDAWIAQAFITGSDSGGYVLDSSKTATKGMTNVTHLKINTESSFTLLTCPVQTERSFHLSFRTLQHPGHPHPMLLRSTPRNFPSGLSPKISRPTELEARPPTALWTHH